MLNDVMSVLQEMKPDYPLENNTLIFESGVFDSFDLLILVSELESKFTISIPGEQLVPENFSSPEAIANFINTL